MLDAMYHYLKKRYTEEWAGFVVNRQDGAQINDGGKPTDSQCIPEEYDSNDL
jgi:proteasome lid subunit RPN8/RPN11